jgi:hypothetical protein
MTTTAPARSEAATSPEVLAEVRRTVRRTLESVPSWAQANPERRRALAQGMVDLGMAAAGLANEEHRASGRAASRRKGTRRARGLSAGDQLGLQATRAAAGALTAAKDAIDFPAYVSSLITGVFQAILTSSTVQIGSLGDLVDGVAKSAEDFEASVTDGEVAAWLTAKFPRLLVASEGSVAAASGVDLSDHAQELSAGLGTGDGDDPSDPETLMDLGRAKMARDKQSTLATMMKLGLQRIVVDEGRIHASMDLRVDATSGSQEARAQRDDWRVNAGAQGGFNTGIWSASASASTSVGQVKSDAQLTNEQIGLRAGLRSSVDLAFRTDQVPIDKLASASARVHLERAARVPEDVSGASILPSMPSNFSAPSLDVPAVPAPPSAPARSAQPSQVGQAGQAVQGAQGGSAGQAGQRPRANQGNQTGQPRPAGTGGQAQAGQGAQRSGSNPPGGQASPGAANQPGQGAARSPQGTAQPAQGTAPPAQNAAPPTQNAAQPAQTGAQLGATTGELTATSNPSQPPDSLNASTTT